MQFLHQRDAVMALEFHIHHGEIKNNVLCGEFGLFRVKGRGHLIIRGFNPGLHQLEKISVIIDD